MVTELPTCYGDLMREMDPETFVSFMKIVAALAIIAMVISVWPVDKDE